MPPHPCLLGSIRFRCYCKGHAGPTLVNAPVRLCLAAVVVARRATEPVAAMSAVSLITSAVSAAAPTGSVAATSSLVTVPLGFGARPTDAPAAPVDGTLGPALSPEQLAEDVGYQVLWAVGMNFVLSSLFFAGRVTSRWMTRVKPRPSDWILLAGILASFGVGGVRWASFGRLARHQN